MVLRILMCFSLLKNVKGVLSTDVPKGAIECINGIRAISMFWVILGHVYAFTPIGYTGESYYKSLSYCHCFHLITTSALLDSN